MVFYLEGPIFISSYVQKVLCSKAPMFRSSYVQKVSTNSAAKRYTRRGTMNKKQTSAAQEKVIARGVGGYVNQDAAQDVP